jgi:hypothetical protein
MFRKGGPRKGCRINSRTIRYPCVTAQVVGVFAITRKTDFPTNA